MTVVRRMVAVATVAVMAMTLGGARAEAPLYEPGVISPGVGEVLPGGECAAESAFDAAYPLDMAEGKYHLNPTQDVHPAQANVAHVGPAYEACQRLKIVFGPIWSKPGQNDVLIQPVTIEKPLYDGYMVRFKPDLVSVDPRNGDVSAQPPRVKDLHLHHGTWLNTTRSYGWGPWLASGEEKTVAIWPKGFGLKILGDDVWLFLHMVHNATVETFPVWVTYDIDFIPADAAEQTRADDSGLPELINTKGIWLDVGDCSHWSESGCVKDTFNPVFNIQRGFGDIEAGACIYPRENCAFQNTFAGKSTQQGTDKSPVFDEWTVPIDGTLVMMGGHLHNGGLRDDVYLVRDGEARLIHISDAYYFDQGIDWDADWTEGVTDFDPVASKVGAPPVSWDFVMTGVTVDTGWAVNVKQGDKLRLEGVYDNTVASWYEQMGIVMSWIVPAQAEEGLHVGMEPFGIDPFDPSVTIGTGMNTTVVQPGLTEGYEASFPGAAEAPCTPDIDGGSLCVRGQMTHARIPTSGDHWNCATAGITCQDIARNAQDGQRMSDIPIVAFGYGPSDLGAMSALGVPTVQLGDSVTFWNLDTPAYMWHSVTRCANPCSGPVSASYPLADGAYDDLVDPDTGLSVAGKALIDLDGETHAIEGGLTVNELLDTYGPDPMDFDSGQIGYGLGANNKLEWEFTPNRTGTFTFYCRIHPSMQGAIRVVE